jgi:hypothetical protein
MTSTVPPDGVSLHRNPGTSCLATISLSLRDKSHPPIEAASHYVSAYVLALMGLGKLAYSLLRHASNYVYEFTRSRADI